MLFHGTIFLSRDDARWLSKCCQRKCKSNRRILCEIFYFSESYPASHKVAFGCFDLMDPCLDNGDEWQQWDFFSRRISSLLCVRLNLSRLKSEEKSLLEESSYGSMAWKDRKSPQLFDELTSVNDKWRHFPLRTEEFFGGIFAEFLKSPFHLKPQLESQPKTLTTS